MNPSSLLSVLATASLSLALTACGPQQELSSPDLDPASETDSAGSRLAWPRLSPDEARAAAAAEVSHSGGITHEMPGITYVRPHGVRPALLAYEVPVTSTGSDGMPVEELVYVDAFDGSVLLRVPRGPSDAEGQGTR